MQLFIPALLVFGFLVLAVVPSWAQMQDHQSHMDEVFWFGVLELPFLFLCVFYSYRTALALRGGVFGKGMMLLFWGFLVMAVGHIAMQLNHIFGYDVFRDTFGWGIGNLLWFLALIITWGLSLAGFVSIYRASKMA